MKSQTNLIDSIKVPFGYEHYIRLRTIEAHDFAPVQRKVNQDRGGKEDAALLQAVESTQRFFRELGMRVRALHKKNGYSQEDMISFGFSTRHWQQIEAGRPITVSTFLRISDVFGVAPERILSGIYRKSKR